jgi:hypothetical protein
MQIRLHYLFVFGNEALQASSSPLLMRFKLRAIHNYYCWRQKKLGPIFLGC